MGDAEGRNMLFQQRCLNQREENLWYKVKRQIDEELSLNLESMLQQRSEGGRQKFQEGATTVKTESKKIPESRGQKGSREILLSHTNAG